MGYCEKPADTLEEEQTEQHEQPRHFGFRLADLRDRIAGGLASLDGGPVDRWSLEPGEQTDPYDIFGSEAEPVSRFPVDRLGYNREAVDERIARLERELDELRRAAPGMSINEEIERLGEQTASILLVAHDKAHETTRLAQEQADRCIADAGSNAAALTERAKWQLQELDHETDAVWRERVRLLDDARAVGAALIALAADAAKRFPEDVEERFLEDGTEHSPQKPVDCSSEERAESSPQPPADASVAEAKPVRAEP